jgi:hypothetical protein
VDWTALGAIIAAVALAGSAIGALLHRRSVRRAQEPRIVFSDLYFAGPSEHPRDRVYSYAIGVRLTNVGGGPALHLHWSYLDENGRTTKLYAEHIHRAALVPHDSTYDWSGIRGRHQEDEPTEVEARTFYERCIAFADCWDSRGDFYLFSPRGGGRTHDPYGGPDALREFLSEFPSRGDIRRSLGQGRRGTPEDP